MNLARSNQPESSAYYLPAHLRICRTPHDTVVLDLRRNRYFCLGERERRHMQCLALNITIDHEQAECDRSSHFIPEETVTRSLLQAGLLSTNASACTTICAQPEALAGVEYRLNAPSPRASDFLQALRAYHWAQRSLSRMTLDRLVDALVERSTKPQRTPEECETLEACEVFASVRPWIFDARNRCLVHALTLRRFLLYRGVCATWFIGVRTRPWAAHSWVQHHDRVLDASPDEVREYTPILAA